MFAILLLLRPGAADSIAVRADLPVLYHSRICLLIKELPSFAGAYLTDPVQALFLWDQPRSLTPRCIDFKGAFIVTR